MLQFQPIFPSIAKFSVLSSHIPYFSAIFLPLYCRSQQPYLKHPIIIQMLGPYLQLQPLFTSISQFKAGQQKFKLFKQSLSALFIGGKCINSQQIPKHMQMQVVLLLAVMNKKHEQIRSGAKGTAESVVKVIEGVGDELSARTKSNAQVLKNYTGLLVKFINFMQECNLTPWAKQVYHTVLILCDKQPESGFFGNKPSRYTHQDINKFAAKFDEAISYFDYDDSDNNKRLAPWFDGRDTNRVHLLRAKERYVVLYPRGRSEKAGVRVVGESSMAQEDVARLFGGRGGVGESVHLQTEVERMQNREDMNLSLKSLTTSVHQTANTNNSTNSKIEAQPEIPTTNSTIRAASLTDSLLLPLKVQCHCCQQSLPQFDCLKWNYVNYCPQCVCDIYTDTSSIPTPRLSTYLKQHALSTLSHSFTCPECSCLQSLPGYSPTAKPPNYTCKLCRKIICVRHRANIYHCFCYCLECRQPTMHMERLRLNYCQGCRFRYCFGCGGAGRQFCGCVCGDCGDLQGGQHKDGREGRETKEDKEMKKPKEDKEAKESEGISGKRAQQKKGHECERRCHVCGGGRRLRECRCGLGVCYGCYYSLGEGEWQCMA